MIWNAIAVTATLTAASVLSKSALTSGAHVNRHHAHEFAQKAVHLKDMALQDTAGPLKLQHASQASAYMSAARVLAADEELEYMLSIDVIRLSKLIDAIVSETRCKLTP